MWNVVESETLLINCESLLKLKHLKFIFVFFKLLTTSIYELFPSNFYQTSFLHLINLHFIQTRISMTSVWMENSRENSKSSWNCLAFSRFPVRKFNSTKFASESNCINENILDISRKLLCVYCCNCFLIDHNNHNALLPLYPRLFLIPLHSTES